MLYRKISKADIRCSNLWYRGMYGSIWYPLNEHMWDKKNVHNIIWLWLCQMLVDFQIFHLQIQQQIFNKTFIMFSSHLKYLHCLAKLKTLLSSFYHYTCYKILRRDLFIFFLLNVIRIICSRIGLILRQASDSTSTAVMCEICCKFLPHKH